MLGLGKSFFGLKRRFRRLKRIFTRVQKDPFLYLGLVSLIFMVSIPLFLNLEFNLFPPKSNLASLASWESPNEENSQEKLFVGPAKESSAESPELLLVQNSSLQAATPPSTLSPQVLGALAEGYELSDIENIIVEYIVEPKDTLSSLATKFNISLNTILWANNLTKGSVLTVGQKLVIPPVSGVIHHVKAGDTVSEISQKYKAKAEKIISFNNLSNEADIYIGDILVVPEGTMPAPVKIQTPELQPLAKSYFILPLPSSARMTQGLHWYNAVDLSTGKCGDPIYAAASGQILKVRITSSTSKLAFGGAGNNLSILHPNGVVTTYGHILVSLVNPGEQVSQGQIIALMGGQPGTPGAGKSTGCHLHFAVTGANNPFAR